MLTWALVFFARGIMAKPNATKVEIGGGLFLLAMMGDVAMAYFVASIFWK